MKIKRTKLANRKLRAIATELADALPASTFPEIYLTGSVARGDADIYSDIEIVALSDKPPSTHFLLSILRRLGVERLIVDAMPLSDGSRWFTFRWRGVWIELALQSIKVQTKLVHELVAGRAKNSDLQAAADALVHARSIRSSRMLMQWRKSLARYPRSLQAWILHDVLCSWRLTNTLVSRVALAHRNDVIALTARLTTTLTQVLRFLCALNGHWEPDSKRLKTLCRKLSRKPPRLYPRLVRMLNAPSLNDRVRTSLLLIADCIKLLPQTAERKLLINDIKKLVDLHYGKVPFV